MARKPKAHLGGPMRAYSLKSAKKTLAMESHNLTGLAIQPAVLHGPWGFETFLESQQLTNTKGDCQVSIAIFRLLYLII